MVDDSTTRAAKGEIFLEEWGLRFPSRLNSREWAAFRAAKELGYAVTSLRRSNLRNIWWDWCQEHGLPFIVVVRGYTRYAWIEISLLSIPGRAPNAIMRELQLMLQRHHRPEARTSCKYPHAFRTHLLVSEAKTIASEAVDLLRSRIPIDSHNTEAAGSVVIGPWAGTLD